MSESQTLREQYGSKIRFRGYKFAALFRKDLKDSLRNSQCLLMMALAIVMVLIYKNLALGGETMPLEFILMFGTLMSLCLQSIAIAAMMIAEEKEKYTLRTLMLSNVSSGEFLLSKVCVVFLMITATDIIIYMLVYNGFAAAGGVPFARYLAGSSATSVSMILLGCVVGILSKNQMTTGLLSSPMALVLLLPSMFGMMDESIGKFSRFLPTDAMIHILNGDNMAFSSGVIAVWTIASLGIFALAYSKKRLDA
ncbi:ABC transporter permease [Clostridia bacterium]|nr:ABC transporter permease [Clostridia bacterium]